MLAPAPAAPRPTLPGLCRLPPRCSRVKVSQRRASAFNPHPQAYSFFLWLAHLTGSLPAHTHLSCVRAGVCEVNTQINPDQREDSASQLRQLGNFTSALGGWEVKGEGWGTGLGCQGGRVMQRNRQVHRWVGDTPKRTARCRRLRLRPARTLIPYSRHSLHACVAARPCPLRWPSRP